MRANDWHSNYIAITSIHLYVGLMLVASAQERIAPSRGTRADVAT